MARRLASAAVSYALGEESIDRTRKEHIDRAEGEVSAAWLQLADTAFEILKRPSVPS